MDREEVERGGERKAIKMRCMAVGMDFYVVLERPGYRVGRRRAAKTSVGTQHRVTKDDAIKW